jgi:aryl-alcohol dehydrogenase-like predicted oxidoreductase
MPTRIPLILVSRLAFAERLDIDTTASGQGAASFGVPNTNSTRIHTLPEAQAVVDRFLSYGQNGFDTSRSYGYGTSEEVCP